MDFIEDRVNKSSLNHGNGFGFVALCGVDGQIEVNSTQVFETVFWS
jgi:hypothetical protein